MIGTRLRTVERKLEGRQTAAFNRWFDRALDRLPKDHKIVLLHDLTIDLGEEPSDQEREAIAKIEPDRLGPIRDEINRWFEDIGPPPGSDY